MELAMRTGGGAAQPARRTMAMIGTDLFIEYQWIGLCHMISI
jgi:hypothetical protein